MKRCIKSWKGKALIGLALLLIWLYVDVTPKLIPNEAIPVEIVILQSHIKEFHFLYDRYPDCDEILTNIGSNLKRQGIFIEKTPDDCVYILKRKG